MYFCDKRAKRAHYGTGGTAALLGATGSRNLQTMHVGTARIPGQTAAPLNCCCQT
jgi:hypothetical protein